MGAQGSGTDRRGAAGRSLPGSAGAFSAARWPTLRLAAGATALLCSGCLSGAIFSHVTVPLDVNLDRTTVYSGENRDSWKTFQYYIRVDWGSAAPGDIAKQHGMTRIHYADLETLTVLGVWTQRWVHVYGE